MGIYYSLERIELVWFERPEVVPGMTGVCFVNRPWQSPALNARSSSIAWELVKNADPWTPFQTHESETVQVGSSHLGLPKPSGNSHAH